MRVITGSARGAKLATLSGDEMVRPTSDMIKGAMFSAIQFYVAGAKVLDLFAGSGQLGIEALSRGAANCVFVDASRDACDIIKENLLKTKLFRQARVMTGDAAGYLSHAKDKFDLIFADPPYHRGIMAGALPLIAPLVAERGLVICETESGAELPQTVGALTLKKRYGHGRIAWWLYQNEA